ncbi:MAG: glycosyltransferase family 4 protein [Gemmatimonadales bacterium]
MTGGPPRFTTLQLTHQGEGAGSTQSIFSLSRELARRGHRVLVGCPAGTLLARMVADEGPLLEHVPLDFRRLRALADALAALIADRRVDVVNSHATGDRRALTWLRWRGRLPQPLVVTRRTMPLTSPPELVAVGLTADRTIAVSAAVASALRRRGHPRSRLRIVPNGIDLARVDAEPAGPEVAAARAALGTSDGRAVVVVVARRKDQQVLLHALPALEWPVTVALVGIRPDRELLAAQAAVPPRHRVVFVPFTERPLAFYRLATVAALPSRIEGLSQALLEAMSLGVPVIASAAGGNPELVHPGETGLLVPPLDPAAWTRALDQMLSDAEFRARVARGGRALARREFTMGRTAERTEVVYGEALARRRLLGRERSR